MNYCTSKSKKHNTWAALVYGEPLKKNIFVGTYQTQEDAIFHAKQIIGIVNNGFGKTEIEKRIVILYEKSTNLNLIIDEIRFSRPTILWLLKNNRINTPDNWFSVDITKVQILYGQGNSFEQISQITGHSRGTIRRAFKKANIKLNYHITSEFLNKKFGPLLINEYLGLQKIKIENKQTRFKHMYRGICDCGLHREINYLDLRKDVKCFHGRKHGDESGLWKGCGEISGQVWAGIRQSALSRNIKFTITIEYCWNLFLAQNKKCALSGLPLYFPSFGEKGKTASLDRISSSDDYTEDNIQWIYKGINMIKNSCDNEAFINLCNLISKINPRETIDIPIIESLCDYQVKRLRKNRDNPSKDL